MIKLLGNIVEPVVFIGIGLFCGFVIYFVKKFVSTHFQAQVKIQLSKADQQKMISLASKGLISKKLVQRYAESPTPGVNEPFSIQKLLSGLGSLSKGSLWGKTIAQELSLRTWLVRLGIGMIILSTVYGYGRYKGKLDTPVNFDLRGQEAHIQLNEHFLHITEDGGAEVLDHEGHLLKTIKVKDIPELRKALKPYGIDIKPFVAMGAGVSTDRITGEFGAGLQVLKWYKWYYNLFVTNEAAYPIGISYRVTSNFDILAGVGIQFDKDFDSTGQCGFLGGKWRF